MLHAVRLLTLFVVALLVAVTFSAPIVSTQGTPSYGIVDVGSLAEGEHVSAAAMDEFGYEVVGSAVNASGFLRAFAGNPYTGLTDLGTLGVANGKSEAADTNGLGAVVGYAETTGDSADSEQPGVFHAFLWSRGAMTDLGTLGGQNSFAHGVNDAETVVGSSNVAGSLGAVVQAFIYRDGAMAPLELGPAVVSTAWAINNKDQVVGHLVTTTGLHRAFLWQNGVATPLGALGAEGFSMAFDINDAGVVVGLASHGPSAASHAFRWENGTMQDLGTLPGGTQSSALAVSEDGTLVAGWATNPQGAHRAVIWRDGQVFDLNDLIKPDTGWVLEQANDAGSGGAVVGSGSHHRVARGFLAVPPIDLRLSIDSHRDDATTNIPNPHEAGTLLRLGASVYGSLAFTATNVVIRDTLTGPVEYVSWHGADCDQDGQTLTCTLAPFDEGRTVGINVRTTGQGPITHSAAIVSSDQVDETPDNNGASEANTAISLASLALASTAVTAGASVLSRVTLTHPVGSGGFYVRLSSNRPDIASVPSPFTVEPHLNGGLYREFYITTKPVSTPVTVEISATFGLVTKVIPLTIMPAGTAFPYGGVTRSIPGIIQAEDYDGGGQNVGYRDTTPRNDGDAYRDDDVDIEVTTDAGGGYNVGWMAATEWLGYGVNVLTAGAYRLDLRVAASGAGGRVHVEFNGVDQTGPMTIPNTGGWQSWTTISAPVTLSAGPQRMRVVVDAAGPTKVVGNVNFIQLTATAPPSTPFMGTAINLPGIVQAENFDKGGAEVAYHDTTARNSGNAYRTDEDVDIQATSDTGGGYNVGWMAPGEWLAYSVNVPTAGGYRLDLRVAAIAAGGRVHVEFNGVDQTGPMTIPNTGGWQVWATISAPVILSAGPQIIRVVIDAAGATGVVCNLNFIQVVGTTSPATPTDIVIYANNVPAAGLHGSWAKASDGASPGAVKLQTPDNGFAVADSPLSSPGHFVDVIFTPMANTPYRLWLRLKALNNDKFNDAVWVQFSGAHANGAQVFPLNSTSGLLVNLATHSMATSLNNWGWVNGAYWLAQPTTFTFPAGGTQSMRIQVREDGVQLDQIVLSPKTYLSAAPGGKTNDGTIVPKP